MKTRMLVLVCCLYATAFVFGQNSPQSGTDAKSAASAKSAAKPGDCIPVHDPDHARIPTDPAPARPDDLKNVLAQANKAAEIFKSAKAKFQWDQYECVVDETDVPQKGEIFFRKTKAGMDASIRVTSPHIKQVVFVDGTLKMFDPETKQLTIYDAKAKRAEVDSLMNIGFGSRSEDILKSYAVTMEGWETVDGVKTARLNLVPKNDKLKSSVTNIVLWLDPVRDISMRQRFNEPGESYRLTHYTDIEVNSKVSSDVFNLKTPTGTTTVRP
jgi:outer membrane lipoprotein-sorting protein